MSRRQPFLNIRTEGALLPSDLLGRLLEGENLPGLKPEDYHLGAGEKLNEAISRSWTRLLSIWASFRKSQAVLPATDMGTTLTREKWLLPLFQELGYGRLIGSSPFEIDGKSYPISHLWHGQNYQVPVHLVSFRADLDRRSEQKIQGASKASPHGLVQEFLNRSEPHLWAFVSNGLTLRILRDNASLTRQAHVEFDLEGIFESEAYADFRLLWMVCHQSRVEGTTKDRPETCWLELWSKQAQTDGLPALKHLRDGVEKALETLGQGFVSHPANTAFRAHLQNGQLHKDDVYRQLLRLAYRLIFLFVSEDRDLLHSPSATEQARYRYAHYYSGQRLRQMAERSRGGRHGDLWVSLRMVFKTLGKDEGCAELGLPALGGFLFEGDALQDLDSCELSNDFLLKAIRHLCLVRDDKNSLRLVDYRNLGSEELGSIYESLLELSPELEVDAGIFTLVTLGGNDRKTTSSYYTSTPVIMALLVSSLDPLLEEAKRKSNPERALLDIKVCDPACGSGHFLVAAAHRIAKHVAAIRTQEEAPAPEAVRTAVRDVIGHCLFGVDLNPMAVELCKVSLWLEAIEPGKPLSFLDHHIRWGNSLLGTTPALISKGVPEEAFDEIDGDDAATCRSLKAKNRQERSGLRPLFSTHTMDPVAVLAPVKAALTALEGHSDGDIQQVHDMEQRFQALEGSDPYQHAKLIADAWVAAFMWFKVPDSPEPPTQSVFETLCGDPRAIPATTLKEIRRLSATYGFFHWHLAFPQIFRPGEGLEGWEGGFDLVFGNPPWKPLSPDEKEFFSPYNPGFRFRDKDGQEQIKTELLQHAAILNKWADYTRRLYAWVRFFRRSGRYRLFAPGNLGKGDFNVYRMFVETALQTSRTGGYASQVVPDGLYNGANAMAIRQELFTAFHLNRLLGFENAKEIWFKDIDTRSKFCIYAAQRGGSTQVFEAAFNIKSVEELSSILEGDGLRMDVRLIHEFSPDALAIMEMSDQLDIDITVKMYSRWPKFGESIPGTPNRVYMRELDMGNDRDIFDEAPDGVPLYEGRMVEQFDHRAKGYRSGRGRSAVWEELSFANPNKSIQPQWRIPTKDIPDKTLERMNGYRIGFCDVTSPTNERSLNAALIPPACLCGDKVPTISFQKGFEWAYMVWLCAANSFVMDFIVRKKVALKMSYTVVDSLPFPRLGKSDFLAKELVLRGALLTCTGPEMTGYWDALAAEGWVPSRSKPDEIPGILDEPKRHQIRAEIDAIVAKHLYGLTEQELDFAMDSFPTLHRRDVRDFGAPVTRNAVIAAYRGLS
jgi:hypothetical protein